MPYSGEKVYSFFVEKKSVSVQGDFAVPALQNRLAYSQI
jgi:hypothetical protein